MYLDTTNNYQFQSDTTKKKQTQNESFLSAKEFEYCPRYVQEYYEELEKNKLEKNKVDKARESVQKDKEENIKFLLFDLCELNNSSTNILVEKYLAELKNPYTLEYIYNIYKADTSIKVPQLIQEQNLKTIAKRIDILDNKKYIYFESYYSMPDLIKGFEMYHDNDAFMAIPGKNQDRELTGGFKFTVISDYMKWRWLRIKNKNKNKDNILTYQTLSLLGNGYTPYIRYRNNFDLADSLHKYDRPFASYMCLERAKHRTLRNGLIRHKGEFQIGMIGISQGRKIQAKIHEDLYTSSQFVHGWEKQIADGGRLIIQANHKFDFLLHSNTNRYRTIFKPNHYSVNDPKGYCDRNLIGEIDLKVGTLMTSLGVGVRFSTLDFLKQSGNHMIVSKIGCKNEFGLKFDFGLNYRYVLHNSLLEGLGLFKTFDEDKYDKVSKDNYVLDKSEIERNMFSLDFGLSLKFRKTTVFFRNTFHTLEYKSRLLGVDFQNQNLTSVINTEDIEHYNTEIIKEQNKFLKKSFLLNKQIYGFGTIGISWIIE
jgi:hypothetical protein